MIFIFKIYYLWLTVNKYSFYFSSEVTRIVNIFTRQADANILFLFLTNRIQKNNAFAKIEYVPNHD